MPNWEWNSLLRERKRIESEKVLNNLYASSAGINGGDFSKDLQESLQEQISFEEPNDLGLLNAAKLFGDQLTM